MTLLSGCGPEAPDASVPTPPVIVVHCGTVRKVSAADYKGAADELAALPAQSIIGTKLLPDWLRMRDEARACEKTNTPLSSAAPARAPAPT